MDDDQRRLPSRVRDRLRKLLHDHPDVEKHIKKDFLDNLPRDGLWDLAGKLGIDVVAIKEEEARNPVGMESTWEPEEIERFNYSHQFPAFTGYIEVPMEIQIAGHRIERQIRFKYQHTPEWEYFDLRKKAPYVGWPGTNYSVEFFEVQDPEIDWEEEPQWVNCGDLLSDGMLPHTVWMAIDDQIEALCLIEDSKRRKEAAHKPPRGRGRKPTH